MARALVTGAAGFVGANVARALRDHGRALRLFVRPTTDRSNLEGLDAEVIVGDLRDPPSVDEAVRGVDEVYHVAAEYAFWSRDPSAIHASNVRGTENVMDAALRHGVRRVVYTSTVGTIGLGGASTAARDEATPEAPGQFEGHYKRSKRDAERVVLAYAERGLPVVIVNPSAPVGPWDRKPTPTGQILLDFVRGRMPAYVETGLNVVHVADVAVGHVLAAEKGRVGERYILGNRDMTLAEIFGVLGRLTGRPAPRIRIPYGVAWLTGAFSTAIADRITRRPPRVALEAVKMARYHMFFSAEKAVRELGLPQTPPERAFRDALEWYAEHLGIAEARPLRGSASREPTIRSS